LFRSFLFLFQEVLVEKLTQTNPYCALLKSDIIIIFMHMRKLKQRIFSWCSNNAMGVWSKVKGKQTGFKGPPAIGQVW